MNMALWPYGVVRYVHLDLFKYCKETPITSKEFTLEPMRAVASLYRLEPPQSKYQMDAA